MQDRIENEASDWLIYTTPWTSKTRTFPSMFCFVGGCESEMGQLAACMYRYARCPRRHEMELIKIVERYGLVVSAELLSTYLVP